MHRRICAHLTFANVASAIALFVALGTGGAYAANTIYSGDIVDGEVRSPDLRDAAVNQKKLGANSVNTTKVIDDTTAGGGLVSADLRPGSVATSEVVDNSLTTADINESLTTNDVANQGLSGVDIQNESLTGTQINESTLVGVKDGCHSGAVLYGYLCAGSDGGTRTLTGALAFCASINLRLPTWSEAVTLAVKHDVPGVGDPPDKFWTDEIATWLDGSGLNTMFAITVDEVGNADDHQATTAWKTVCVETPTNVPHLP